MRVKISLMPNDIKLSDMADFIKSIEGSLFGIIEKDFKAVTTDRIIVSLSGMDEGSTCLAFSSTFPDVIDKSYNKIITAIRDNRAMDLPGKSQNNLDNISKFTQKNKCTVEFFNGDSQKPLAYIDEHTKLLPEPVYIKESTVIYGEIERIGGAGDYPTIQFRLLDGNLLHPKVRNKETACKISPYLYKQVGLKATAIINFQDGEIKEFVVEDITEYEQVPIDEAFDELREEFGKYFDNIDVIEYCREIRGAEDEE